MERIISVSHQSLLVKKRFGPFTQALEALLATLSPEELSRFSTDAAAAEANIRAKKTYQDLFLFNKANHGELFNLKNDSKNCLQYTIGNPLIAFSMTSLDLRAGLYAPLRILVFETEEGKTIVEYDLPSSLFGQFGIEDITRTGEVLDQKLSALIKQAAENI